MLILEFKTQSLAMFKEICMVRVCVNPLRQNPIVDLLFKKYGAWVLILEDKTDLFPHKSQPTSLPLPQGYFS